MATFVGNGSILFDPTAYLNANADVKAAGSSLSGQALADFAYTHFLTFGAKEGRDPLGMTPSTSVPNTLTKGALSGDVGGTGSATGGLFDAVFYLNNNADVARVADAQGLTGTARAAFALDHFIQFGAFEGRAPSANFNPQAYANSNSDVAGQVALKTITAIQHYLQYGEKEGRSAPAVTGGTGSGTTFTLTTGADNITTTGNATVTGVIGSTLTAADNITGGGSGNVLSLTATAAQTDATASALISGMQTIQIRATNGTVALDATKVPGATTLASNLSTSEVDFTNVGNNVTIGAIGNGSLTNGNITFAENAAANSLTLSFSGGTAFNTTGGAGTGVVNFSKNAAATTTTATSATITSTGAANTVGEIVLTGGNGGTNTLAAITKTTATLTSLTIKADSNLTAQLTQNDFASNPAMTVSGNAAKVSLTFDVNTGTIATPTAGADTFKTIDASGLTQGGISIALGTSITSFKGGQGNDTVTTAAVATTTAGTVDAGAGTGDTLIVATATDVNSASKGAVYANFEILQNNTTSQIDASLISGITSVVLNGGNGSGFSNLSATQAAAVSVKTSQTGGTLALANASGTSDQINLTLTNTAAATAVDAKNLTLTGIEILSVTDNAQAASTVSFTGGSGLKQISIGGSQATTLDISSQTAALTTIDASGLTGSSGKFTLTDSGGSTIAQSFTVTGSAQADTFGLGTDTFSTGAVVQINGGGGNDTLSASEAQLFTSGAGYVGFDGGAGSGDQLTITTAAPGTVSDSVFAHITNVEKLSFTGAGTLSLTSGGFFNSAFNAGVTISDTAVGNNASTVDLTLYNGGAETLTLTTGAVTAVTSVVGGAGADSLTVTAASYTGASAGLVISGGAGNDTITESSITTGVDNSVVITGGTGADSISMSNTGARSTNNQVTVVVNAGDSTTTAFDTVSGFHLADGTNWSDKLDVSGTATIAANATAQTVTGFTNSQLNYTIASGIISFAGTSASASASTVAQEITLAQQIVTNNLDSVAFTNGGNTYVFHHDTGTGGDTVVQLTGVSAAVVTTTNTLTTANALFVI